MSYFSCRPAAGVLDVHCDGRCIGDVTQAAALGGDVLIPVLLLKARLANVDVGVPEAHRAAA